MFTLQIGQHSFRLTYFIIQDLQTVHLKKRITIDKIKTQNLNEF
jgi:hypothetical protein